MICLSRLFALLVSGCSVVAALAGGPGLGNLAYAPDEHFQQIARFDATNGVPRGHGFVNMHRGWLMVIFSADGGGGNGTGGFAFYDVSDPRNPVNTFTTAGHPVHEDPGSPHYAGDIREPHGYSFWGDILCVPTNRGQGTGLQFWDLSEIAPPSPAPARLSHLVLPGLSGGDYAPTPWWVFWQGGRYAYVAGTSGGIYIVDASDPANPVLADRGPGNPNPIPTSQTGGFQIHTVFAIGNLLVTAVSDGTGIATFDIGDPLHPVLLQARTTSLYQVGYSMMVNGNRILGAHNPARIFDISNPSDITHIGNGPQVASKGGYGSFQDGVFHYGSSSKYVKLDVSQTPFAVLGEAAPTGFANPDWDFASALGNLVYMGNDHSGSALIVHDTAPDTTGPVVNMVNPPPDSLNRPLTSRVGVTLTDQIDGRSVTGETFVVRPLGGGALAGRYSNQTGILNFWPDQPLLPNTTYEVVLPAGGAKDSVGNGLETTFTSRFSTGGELAEPILIEAVIPEPHEVGVVTHFSATASGPEGAEFTYVWTFGDGSPATAPSASPDVSHTYLEPGHYSATVTASDGISSARRVFTHTVHRPLTAERPASSGPIIFDQTRQRVWNVNPDAGTVTASDAVALVKLFEMPAGAFPRTLAQAPDGAIFVANTESATLSVLDPDHGGLLDTIFLPRASRPVGIAFSPDGSAGWVTLEATGELLRLDPAARAVTGSLAVGPTPRGIAVDAGSQRVFATRFRSPDTQGEVVEVDVAGLSVTRVIPLAFDETPDSEDAGRGVPNYIQSLTISPDGLSARVPSKKDNIARGLRRDGLPLTFESTVRTIVSEIDLLSGTENPAARRDLNDRDLANAVIFSPLGDYFLVATQGTNAIDVFDAYTGAAVTAIENVGLAPQGLALSADGSRLFVQNFMSRTVAVFDVSGIFGSTAAVAPRLAEIAAVAEETLAPEVLLGKRIFHNAADPRMNRDGYLSCASCHLDGGHDGRTWDFSDRGEGLRNTTTLIGGAGTGGGMLHWSGNFDEVQDFENDIRSFFGGRGFMSDADFHAGTRSHPLGDPKQGKSADLDALAAYLGSLDAANPSPHREQNGSLTADAQAGRQIFRQLRCYTCHSGPAFSDSRHRLLHDVGTLKETSGHRLGGALAGLDTPTLKGVWETAPYLHDGSAGSLGAVLSSGSHGGTASLSETGRQQLVAYLLQIEDGDSAPDYGPLLALVSPPAHAAVQPGDSLVVEVALSPVAPPLVRIEFFEGETKIGEATAPPYRLPWTVSGIGAREITARAVFAGGTVTTTFPVPVHVFSGQPATTSLTINFQPDSAPVPAGAMADTGLAFGDRGNGWSYGWNAATHETRRRNNPASPSPAHDTLNHLQKPSNPNAVWEIALPDGLYGVRIVAGDADHFDGFFRTEAEGVTVVDGAPATGSRWVEGGATVAVGDGRLTVRNGPGAQNNKICFIEIGGIPVDLPQVSLSAPVSETTEGSSSPIVFRLSRDGNTSAPLDVALAIGGTATNGADHTEIPAVLTIPAGAGHHDLQVFAMADEWIEGDETLVLSVRPDVRYGIASPSVASALIRDEAYQKWAAGHFTPLERLNAARGGPFGDANGDGLANLLHYSFGVPPSVPIPADFVRAEIGTEGFFEIKYRLDPAATGVTLTAESSTDLIHWSADHIEYLPGYQENPDGTRSHRARDIRSPGSVEALFFRLRASPSAP